MPIFTFKVTDSEGKESEAVVYCGNKIEAMNYLILIHNDEFLDIYYVGQVRSDCPLLYCEYLHLETLEFTAQFN